MASKSAVVEGINSKKIGYDNLLSNLEPDMPKEERKYIKDLFSKNINGVDKLLDYKFKNWTGSKKSDKFIDLCFDLGKSYVEKNDELIKALKELDYEDTENKVDCNDHRKKALIYMQMGVDIAEEIKHDLNFDQMIDYGHLLLRGPISSMSLLEYCEDLVPNARTKKAMKWLEKCLCKMESKKFRPKQINICEALLAIAYYQNKKGLHAFEYFVKSLDQKSRHLPNHILWDFLKCGIDTLKSLGKKEELIQLYKVRLQFGDSTSGSNYVEELMELFEVDYEIQDYGDVEESPYFHDVLKAIDKHNKDPEERPSSWPTTEDFGPNPVNAEFCEFAKLYYLDFAYKLLKLGALTNFIPKCLDQVAPYVNSKYPYIEFYTFKFYHTYMKYCYMNGEYEKCIDFGNLCIKYFHVEMIEKEIAPDFGCEGSLCLAKTISNAYIELGNLGKAISTLKTLSNRFSKSEWEIDVSVQIAQCLRMQGKYFEAKKALDESPNKNDDYKNIFRGMCYSHLNPDDLKKFCDKEFEKVIKKIKSFNDVKELFNRNKKEFQMFPQDAITFVDRIVPILKKQPNSVLSLKFVNQIFALKNSLSVSEYLRL